MVPGMKPSVCKPALLFAGAGLLLCCITGCFRNDIRTETLHLDPFSTPDHAARAAEALRAVNGVQDLRPDLGNHTLTVEFNGRVAYLKNIEFAVVEAGFSLPHWPASALKDAP